MSAYIIALIEVTDPEQYKQYTEVTPAAIAKFGGKFIARGGETVVLEGPEPAGRVVIIEFPTLERAQSFYASEEYRQAKALRAGAATAQFIAVDGV